MSAATRKQRVRSPARRLIRSRGIVIARVKHLSPSFRGAKPRLSRVRVRFAPRNDSANVSLLAARGARAMSETFSPFCKQGRGECRVRDAPAAWCAQWGRETCTPVFTAEAPETSGIPHAMVYGLYALFPGTIGVVDPVGPCDPRLAARLGSARTKRTLTPTMGRQNHTISPSATPPLVSRAATAHELRSPCDHMRTRQRRVHHSPPRVRDDRDTPLAVGRDGDSKP